MRVQEIGKHITGLVECNSEISIPVKFKVGSKSKPNSDCVVEKLKFQNLKATFTYGDLEYVSSIFSGADYQMNTQMIVKDIFCEGDEILGTIYLNVGDTCSLSNSNVIIHWTLENEEGQTCVDLQQTYRITADMTCCQVNRCKSSELTCDVKLTK